MRRTFKDFSVAWIHTRRLQMTGLLEGKSGPLRRKQSCGEFSEAGLGRTPLLDSPLARVPTGPPDSLASSDGSGTLRGLEGLIVTTASSVGRTPLGKPSAFFEPGWSARAHVLLRLENCVTEMGFP